MKKLALLLLNILTPAICFAEVTPDQARNWHQWRGPSANGVSTTADPPTNWSETQNVKWKVEVPGRGSSSPIVWGDRVFLLTAIPTDRRAADAPVVADASSEDPGRGGGRGGRGGRRGPSSPPPMNVHQFVVLCFDRQSGEKLWQQVATEALPHEGLHPTNTHASSSAITDGRRLYASFGSHGIFCYDLEGNLVWQRDLGQMETRNGFGEGGSPTLYHDTLIVPWDHEGPSFIAALDAGTGKTKWKVDRDEVTTWNTPLVVEHNGRAQVVINGSRRSCSYDVESGELIWECSGQGTNPIASPLTFGGVVFCVTGYQGYAVYAIPLDAQGDISETGTIAWRRTDTGSYVSSPILYGKQLYVTKAREAILTVMDATSGDTVYGPRRLPGLDTLYASPVAAAGRVYYTDRNGRTTVIEQGREFQVLATNELAEGVDASPALVAKDMFVRGEKHLYCITNE